MYPKNQYAKLIDAKIESIDLEKKKIFRMT